MKKLLLVFCITLSFIIPALRAHAQTIDWSCFTTSGTILADATDNATVAFTNALCPAANGFSLEAVGTGEMRIFASQIAGNFHVRTARLSATSGTFNYSRFFRTSGGLFTLTGISVSPTNAQPATGGPQSIILHAYRNGSEVTSTSIGPISIIAPVAVPSAQLSGFTNIDEVRFTSSSATALGILLDDIVVAVAANAPTVTTGASSAVTANSATLAGNVSSDGGATVSEKGIVYGTSMDPTIADTKLTNGSGTGAISANASGLAGNTTYHYRAYATNVIGTSYGIDQTFKTLSAALISTTGTLAALTTTYGTASASGTFNVSGVGLGAGILVTAPTGFEVSTDDITFSNTVTVGSAGTVASTPVHIRLAAGINAGNYSGNVVLSSAGATSVNVPTVASTVNKAALTITASIGQNKIYGNVDPALTYAITTGALVGTDAFTGSLTRAPGENFGTYAIQQGTLALSSNYTLTYVGANFNINKAAITLTADTKNKVYGDADPVLTFKITSGTLKFADTFTGSLTRAPGENVGTYAIQQGTLALSSNYTLTYIAGNIVVDKAALTITADNKGKPFGQTLAGGPGSTDFTSTGLVNSETIGSVTITYGTGAAAGAPANTYTGSVVASAATGGTFNASNYIITYVAGNIIVGQAVLTITATSTSKAYGEPVPTLSVSYSGFIGTDDESSLTTKPTISTTAVTNSPVNTYPITASGAVSSNYTIVYNPGILTVNKAPLTITANSDSKVYGAPVPTLTVSYSGFVGTDNASSLTTQPTISTPATISSPVNTYPITASGAVSANYTFIYQPGTLTVTPAALTITANDANKVYGAPVPALSVSYSGFVGTDDASSLTTQPTISTPATINSPVNTYPITASGAVSSNYSFIYQPGSLTVNPAPLTITANNKGKAFGQTLTGGPGSTEFTSTGLVNSETIGSVTITYGTGAAAGAPANTYTGSVVASAATSGTFNASNYTITYVAGNIIVGQAVLTITANSDTKVYGAPVPTLTVSYSGFIGTDDASSLTTQPTISTTAVTNSPVNTYPITVSGAVSSNYTIVYNPGTLTVTPAPLTITANSDTKVYGAPVPTLAVSYSGFVGTDDASSLTTQPTISTPATINSPVNTYPITASGAVSSNYTFIYQPGTLTVTPAALTITANSDTKVYGAPVPALTVSYSGFVGTDDASSLTTQPTISTPATINSLVNTYPITASGAVSSNYSFIYQPGTLTVTPAALTITANSDTKVYGALVPTLAVSYSGFVGTDNASSLTTQPTISTTAVTNSPVNTYPITPSGAVSSNYTFIYQPGTLTVTPAALTITANSDTKVYGALVPTLAVSYSGFVGTDDASSLTTQPTISTTAVTNSPVNTYPITPSGAVSSNYSFIYQPGTLTVTPAALTITADNKGKAFGQALTSGLGSTEFTSAGLVNSETIGSVTITYGTGSAAGAPANTYIGSVVASAASGGTFNASNYTITYVAGNIIVGQAVLTITANDANKVYGALVPTLTVSYSGFVGTDDASSLTTQPTISTTAVTNSPVNTYPITASGAVSSNYTFVYQPGTLTVTPTPLTITANDANKVYGAPIPTLAVSYSGFVGTDDASSLTTQPTISTPATINSPVNTYPITASGAVSSNYIFVYQPGVLTVTKAVLNITANSTTKTYGAAVPALSVSYTGFVGTDDASSLSAQPAVSTTATINSPVNTYPITASGAASANYTFVYKPGVLTVTKAVLTITADNLTKVFGAINPTLTVSYSGFAGTDNASSLTTQPTVSTTAITNSPVNTYPITASGAVSANYSFVYKAGVLTVTKAVLTITANNATKVYGTVNPPLSVSYSGFKGTDDVSNLTIAPTISTTAVTGSPVNTYPITASGAVSANYSFVYKAGVLTVTKAVLTITANNATKTYGSANPALSVSYSGFVGTDKVSCLITQPTVSTTAVTNSPVGTYPITARGAVASNYSFIYKAGVLTVTKAVLTITAKNATKVYGTVNPALTVTYTGFAGTDNAASLTTAPTISTTAVTSSQVNTYPITASGAVSENYSFVYKAGVLTVTKAVLTIKADNITKAYGAVNPPLTISYSGFAGTDNEASLTTAPKISTTAVTNSPVNTYPITVSGAVSPNYSFIYKPGVLTVTQPVLTITANNATKTYGSANPALSVSYSGFVNGDNSSTLTKAPVIVTTASTSSNAGTYPITVSGAAIANYRIVYVSATLTVNKATLTVTVDNKSRDYGASNPAFTAAYSGFVNGDNQASLTTQPLLKTVATTTSAPGSYPITASGGVSANYNFNYVAGVLSVKPLSISTLDDLTLSSGMLSPSFATNIAAYTAQVDNSIDQIRLTLKFHATATAKVNGTSTPNGSPSADIPLNVGYNTITAVVTAQDGITTSTYTVTVYRGESQESIVATNILSPNGDGKNDVWSVKDIQLFPNNTVVVYDRAGRTVYTKHGYSNNWDGTFGGSPLTEGSYYYTVDLGPGQRKFKGFITIVRTR